MKHLTPALLLFALVACNGAPAGPSAVEPAPVDRAGLVAEARAQLAASQPLDALNAIDELQAARPDDAEAAYLRGVAFLAAAEAGQSAADFYLDAQAAFERAAELGYGPDALAGASRAARMNFQPERALEHARAARAAYEAADPRPALEQPLDRTLVEALFGAYVERRQAGEDAPALYAETGERLTALTRAQPDDPWAFAQLANLYQWGAQPELALQAQEHVLRCTPDDQAAHARAVVLARAAGGREAVLALYERFGAAHPGSALTPWYLGVETFEMALAALEAQQDSAPRFERAGQLFARCRELEPEFEASCQGYEVMCRNGVGWARFAAEDLAGAQAAFLSMNAVLPGGIEWQIEGRLLSGILGLQFVADAWAQQGQSEFDLTGKPEAAAVFDLLRELKPEDGNFANNAGFFHRDACVVLELMARARLQQAEGRRRVRISGDDVPIEDAEYEVQQVEVAPEEAEVLRAEAAELRARAVEHADKSYRAYQAAARLMSEDVRVVNDAALVMVYHIRKDVEEMEGLLRQAIALGEEQTRDPELPADELDPLQEAWGDAHQNLGLVYLTLKDDPETARTWFQRAFEIGPRPRVDRAWVEHVALPACDKLAAGDPDALEGLDPRLWLDVRP